jgi:L-2,4-diaminobutyrate decarboxylase
MSFLKDSAIVSDALQAYFQESMHSDKPVINQQEMGSLIQTLGLQQHISNGDLRDGQLKQFLDSYLESTTRLHHPAYLAHQVAAPHYAGALASFVDGFTNNPMAIYEMGPGAAAIEYFMVNWLLEKVGWKPAPVDPGKSADEAWGGGVLTHGGSLANMTALIAARSHLVPDVWQRGNPPDLALLAPAESHYSIGRAAGVLGIGSDSVYALAVDNRGVIIPDRLPQALQRLRDNGKRPLALVANACSTALGLYDPLEEIGSFCREEGVWFHVDGAHGASALVSEKYRHLLRGVELADSLIWDAHKLMRTPTVCAALLVRDGRTLDNAFQQEASYLFHDKVQPGFDFIHRALECTKAGLGLRLFMVLGALGEQGMADYIDRQYDLAREVYPFIMRQPDLYSPAEPQANILCFRIEGDDSLQLEIRDRLMALGSFYLSTAKVDGKRYLRIALMNPETDMQVIEALIEAVRLASAMPMGVDKLTPKGR